MFGTIHLTENLLVSITSIDSERPVYTLPRHVAATSPLYDVGRTNAPIANVGDDVANEGVPPRTF